MPRLRMTRRCKVLAPLLLFGLVIAKVLQNMNGQVSKIPINKARKQLTIVPPTEPYKTSKWLLTTVTNTDECVTLAARFPSWNFLLIVQHASNIEHSRCKFLLLSELLKDVNGELVTSFGNSTQHLVMLLGAIHLSKLNPDNIITTLESKFIPDNIFDSSRVLFYSGNSKQQSSDIFSTHRHFGSSASRSKNDSHTSVYKLCDVTSIALQARPVVHFADTSPVQSSSDKGIGTAVYDRSSPPVGLNKNQFAVVDLTSGVFRSDWMWLVGVNAIVSAAHENVHLINMGLQKIIWITNEHIALSSDVLAVSSADVTETHIRAWIKLLDRWTCLDNTSNACVLHLLLYLKNNKRLREATFRHVQQYLALLAANNYNFPPISGDFAIPRNCDPDFVHYQPVHFGRNHTSQRHIPVRNLQQMQYNHEKLCGYMSNARHQAVELQAPWMQFPDVLLIVVFNNAHYDAIPHIELLYNSFFPLMLFCGPTFPDQVRFPFLHDMNGVLNRTFIAYGSSPKGHVAGAFNYACAAKAMRMRFKVNGYLVIADDTLLLVNTIKDFRQDTVWFLPRKAVRVGEITKLRECKLGMCDFYPHWDWWADYKDSVISFLARLEEERVTSLLHYTCYEQLVQFTGARMRAVGGYSDVYYVPQRLASDFATLTDLLLEHRVFLEIAVPTAIHCLEHAADIVPMPHLANWLESRDRPWDFFTKHHLFGKKFYHPVKWGYINASNVECPFREFYCSQVLPFLHDITESLPRTSSERRS